MLVYIDSKYKAHVSGDDTMRAVEVPFFDGKCQEFIEGFRYIPDDEVWIDDDGLRFEGPMYSAWKDYEELSQAQIEYERQLIKQLKIENGIMKDALAELGVTEDD